MPISQLITTVGRSAGGGGGTGPALTPIDSGVSLGVTWTVEFIANLFPTSFWATMWGNEVWDSGLGHLAYLTGTTSLNVGSPNAADEYTLAQDVSVKSYWAFTHTDGGGIDVYRNGVLLTPTVSMYSQPTPASNTLLFGARHINDGTGGTDAITNGTFYWTTISTVARDAGYIAAQYASFQGPYGI